MSIINFHPLIFCILLDIFERMKKEHPHIKLLFVGNGQLYQKIIKLVKNKNLEETIFFTGFCKNVNKNY